MTAPSAPATPSAHGAPVPAAAGHERGGELVRLFRRPLFLAALSLLALALVGPARAWSFKAGGDFGKPAAVGGGSDIYFTGAPIYHKWTCTLCHQDAPGKVGIRLEAGGELLSTRRYRPGAAYQIKITLVGEHLGMGSALNTNGMATTVSASGTSDRQAGGRITGYDANLLRQGYDENEVVSTGLVERETSWAFTWIAPGAGQGAVTFYVGVVDGDGASRTDKRTSDPLHDDVAMGSLRLDEGPP